MKPYKVDEPKYQIMQDIAKDYWGNWLLISNFDNDKWGGIVRYYYPTNDMDLTHLIMEMDKDEDTYGSCVLRYVGDKPTLGGIYI